MTSYNNSAEPDQPQGVTLPELQAMMAESQFWSPRQIQDYQILQLSQLLVHAQQTTHFYKDRLSPVLLGNGQFNWSRWNEIPVLKRADLMAHGDDLLSNAVPQSHGPIYSASSSGSTGVPVTVTFPELFVHVAKFAWKRFRSLHGVDYGPGITDFKPSLPRGAEIGAETFLTDEDYHEGRKFLIRRDLPISRKLEALAQSPFKILQDSPNHAEIMARENLRREKPVRLDFIVGIGMPISADQRSLYLESFGAKALSPYSSKEGSLMAFQCCHGNDHFHICQELVLLEIVDEKNRQVPVGAKGRVLITPFFNSAQPLIRYEQGDIVVRGAGCPGGLTLPVIKEISGRKDAIFKFPDRDVAIVGLDVAHVRKLLEADAFQFAQVGPRLMEVRYVAPEAAAADAMRTIAEIFTQLCGTSVEYRFKHVADIPFNAGGKQQRFVREYEPSQ